MTELTGVRWETHSGMSPSSPPIISNMELSGSKALRLLAIMLVFLVTAALGTGIGSVTGNGAPGSGAGTGNQEEVRRTCQNTFFSNLVQLIPCRPAVAPFSPYQPSEACCSAIKILGQPCLCAVVNGLPISGVDRNMAVQLPEKCTTNFEPCISGRK